MRVRVPPCRRIISQVKMKDNVRCKLVKGQNKEHYSMHYEGAGAVSPLVADKDYNGSLLVTR